MLDGKVRFTEPLVLPESDAEPPRSAPVCATASSDRNMKTVTAIIFAMTPAFRDEFDRTKIIIVLVMTLRFDDDPSDSVLI